MWAKIITWLSKNWNWFTSFFSEIDGASTTRALNWIWLIVLCLNITFITVFNAIKTHEAKLPPIDGTSGYVAITSLLLAAKVGQRIWGENPVTSETTGSASTYSNILSALAAQYSGSVTASVSPSTYYVPPTSSTVIIYTPITASSSVSSASESPLPVVQPVVITVDPNNP